MLAGNNLHIEGRVHCSHRSSFCSFWYLHISGVSASPLDPWPAPDFHICLLPPGLLWQVLCCQPPAAQPPHTVSSVVTILDGNISVFSFYYSKLVVLSRDPPWLLLITKLTSSLTLPHALAMLKSSAVPKHTMWIVTSGYTEPLPRLFLLILNWIKSM